MDSTDSVDKLNKIKKLALNIGFIEDDNYNPSNIISLSYKQYILWAFKCQNLLHLQICEYDDITRYHTNHFFTDRNCEVRNINYKHLYKRLEGIFKYEFRKMKINNLLNENN